MAFPGVTLLDPLDDRNESPLSHAGDWFVPAWANGAGACEKGHGFGPTQSEHASGAEWTKAANLAVRFEVATLAPTTGSDGGEKNLQLNLGLPSSGLEEGYLAAALSTGAIVAGTGPFLFVIAKLVGAEETLVSEPEAFTLTQGDWLGLTALNGVVALWHGASRASMAIIGSGPDTAFTAGRVGFSVQDGNTTEAGRSRVRNLEASVGTPTREPTFANEALQDVDYDSGKGFASNASPGRPPAAIPAGGYQASVQAIGTHGTKHRPDENE